MTAPTPLASIIIPTYGRPRQLAECLEGLSSLDFERSDFEVIVVDDGSPEPLDAVVAPYRARLELRLLRQANGGPASARNTGAAVARGRLLAFTDDDCRPDPDWLHRLVEQYERMPDCLLGGHTENGLPENPCSVASQLIQDVAYAHYNRDPSKARFFASNNMAIPADGFAALGGFDTAFRIASEDRDLCDRWRALGGCMVYVPRALVHHHHHLTIRGFLRQHFGYGRGARRFHRARVLRGARGASAELAFHLGFLRLVGSQLARLGRRRAINVGILLVLWQVSNASGFFYELVAGRSGAGETSSPDADLSRSGGYADGSQAHRPPKHAPETR